ncbi:MAG: DEAD/DEAH box helicase family protein [Helicobacteraceae bacterium]|jgi:type III restriction enzyme|nr:DEAD/DEAH box helicase family protein [Helicobacteraceae bacterium]
MTLKTYQQNTLDALRRFFEECRVTGARSAYKKIASEPEIAARLGKLRGEYVLWDSIPNTPRVCLKVPTGGGKTIIAARAIKIAADIWRERENPLVLWFCPSDTIRRQTSEALKNPRHPYRMELDGQFNGRVRIFDLDEKFNIRPADIENNACVIVSTIQAFRQSNTDKYNVYKHNEDLEPHFTHIPASEGMEKDDKGNLKFSFANLLFNHRPIVIVDEAHNVISGLSQEVQGRINPSAIVELTATPQLNNNTLYNVRAVELKEEEMIKLPIELREYLGWEEAADQAIMKRAELEEAAKNEKEYIRPILLFQAQDKSGEVNVEVLKNYLINTANIPANEIAVATGEQKELDGVNVFARDCPVKYIITVEALKEGWDCSFAYVLCSLANVKSNTLVEQLLGRVMRMPYAKSRKISALNKAYAYVLSKTFGEAADALVKKLADKGFDDTEAISAIEQRPSELYDLFGRSEIDKVDLEKPLQLEETPTTFKIENDGKTIVFTQETTEADIARIVEKAPEKAAEIEEKFYYFKRRDTTPSPAATGASFRAPLIMVNLQGEFVFADPDLIFEEFGGDILEFADPKLEDREFNIEPQGRGYVINLDGNQLKYGPSGEQNLIFAVDFEYWTDTNLIYWLDGKLRQNDISQPKRIEWLRQAIDYLVEIRGLSLSSIMIARYALANELERKIRIARNEAREKAFHTTLFGREDRVKLDFDNGFEFFESMYNGEMMYQGYYKFQKHYLGSLKVPMFDGGGNGEEFACAKELDALPQVKYWLRNIARHKNSFWLPTSTDKFYPDFVAMLEDGRILVVEYKGSFLIESKDTKEKKMIGEFWEKLSNRNGLFLLAADKKNADGLSVLEQIKKKIGVL